MSNADIHGREYAKMSDLSAGATVQVDGDFTCIDPWSTVIVSADASGHLYVPCADGKHYLDGQMNGASRLVGIYEIGDVQ